MTYKSFENILLHPHLHEQILNKKIRVYTGIKSVEVEIFEGLLSNTNSKNLLIPLDYIKKMPQKVASVISSKTGANTTIFARNCEVKKAERKEADLFLEAYHLMGSTQSAFNFGLFYKNNLVAIASFSKGRKMNRLTESERSFELIRFCCKPGITITGGLTKLVKNFCREKNAGDIMTYIDKQLSDGEAFIKAGFKFHSEKEANYFLINKSNFERQIVADKNISYNSRNYYLTQNCGNLKLIYTPVKVE